MHTAPAHLESKLRFWDLSVGQIAAAFVGIMLGVVWAKFVSPFHGMLGAMSGAYIAALPVIPVFVASQTEFDLAGLVAGALRWRRLDGRYVPGAGEDAQRLRAGASSAPRSTWPAARRARARSAGAVGGSRRSDDGQERREEQGRRRAAGGGGAAGGRGDRPHRADRDQRGRVRADLQGGAAEPAADVGGGAREDRGHVPAAGLAAEGRGDAAVLHRRAAGEPGRAAGRLPAGGGGERGAGADDGPAGARPLALARWRLYAAMEESLRLHADEQAATEVSAYVVVPFLPRQSVARAALAWVRRRRLPTAPLERPLQAHRRAVREHLAHVDALRSELEAEGMPTELLDGEEVVRLLWARFNPTKADKGRRAPSSTVEVLGELDAPSDRDVARQAAMRLKEQIAQSSLDFSASHQHVVVDHDVEQTILVHNTAGRTQMGWLHGAMLTRQPFTLSVFVHGLERRRERQKLKLAYRRLFTINRGAEQRGRVPDFDRYVQEREYQELLGEMATGETSNLFRVSIYQTLRARGPDPNLAALSEAVDFCAESIESAGDCKVNRGEFRQHELWPSSLPLGRDIHGKARKYPTANAGDMLPLVGTKCGSPTGIPFAFADPGRTVELLNPYDEEHANYTMRDRRAARARARR